MEVREVKVSEWPMLAPIFRSVFHSDLPPPEHGKFIGVFQDGKIEAFCCIEEIQMLDQFWSRNEKTTPKYMQSLIKYVREKTPPRQTVATIGNGKRGEILFQAVGFQKIPGVFFRRNGI